MTFLGSNQGSTLDGNGNVINSVLAATGVNGLAVATVATNFIFSTNNSTTTQLAPNATYTGTIETALSQPAISMLMASDQTMVINVRQFVDLAGTSAVPVTTFTVPANQQFSRSLVLNGNYVQISVTNQGSATTTTFKFDTAYGTIGAVDSQGNMPVVGYLTGQTTGDFDSVPLLDNITRGDLALHTKSINNPTQDVNGNIILSDSPSITKVVHSTIGQAITIDTIGYNSIEFTTQAFIGTVLASNDNITYSAIGGINNAGAWVTTLAAANTSYIFPCQGRYIKLTSTTVGAFSYTLRTVPFMGQNLAAIGGAAVSATTGQLGVNLITSQAATNGQTLGTLVAPLTVSATVIKATAGRLYSISVGNAQATAVYLKVYNAASVTLGTTSPIQNYLVPGGTTGGTFNVDINDYGLFFSTGICIAVTGGQPLLDSTALTTAAVVNYSFI